VHGFVHETRRDGLRRGRCGRSYAKGRARSVEVSAAARDRLRQRGRVSCVS